MPITVQYLRAQEIAAAMQPKSPLSALCVVGYGVSRPKPLAEGCPFVRINMTALTEPVYELWASSEPVTYETVGGLACATAGDVLLTLATEEEKADRQLEHVAEDAYRQILHLMHDRRLHILRTWNYLPDITGPVGSGKAKATSGAMERYRRFNVGRYDAFVAHEGRVKSPPAASALGTRGRPIAIYALSGIKTGTAVENPRQVSAYKYPSQYGPRSPSFSRATLATVSAQAVLFISGTASIVGHASVHHCDVGAQTIETMTNIRAVLAQAQKAGFHADLSAMQLKIYLRRPLDLLAVRTLIEAEFGKIGGSIYLRGDVCRTELLVEIEAFCPGTR